MHIQVNYWPSFHRDTALINATNFLNLLMQALFESRLRHIIIDANAIFHIYQKCTFPPPKRLFIPKWCIGLRSGYFQHRNQGNNLSATWKFLFYLQYYSVPISILMRKNLLGQFFNDMFSQNSTNPLVKL